jgi:hypothetical protein
MAESKHDDVADALARLAGGDGAPNKNSAGENSPGEPLSGQPAPAAPVPPVKKTVRPATARPAGARAVGSSPIAPPAPKAPGPTPTAPGLPARPPRPAAPVLGASASAAASPSTLVPPATAGRPVVTAPQSLRRQRPAAPMLGTTALPAGHTEVDGDQSTALSNTAQSAGQNVNVVDDDDSVIVPAPDPSAFIPRQKSTGSAEARAAVAAKKNLEYRRTLIPILLTCGTLLLGFGILKFVAGSDSTLQFIPSWIPIGLLCTGALLLALAGVNMMSVKQQLTAAKSES